MEWFITAHSFSSLKHTYDIYIYRYINVNISNADIIIVYIILTNVYKYYKSFMNIADVLGCIRMYLDTALVYVGY